MRLVRVRQTSTGTDIPILVPGTPIAPLRPCCHASSYVRSRDMGYNERTRKMLRTTQRRKLRFIFQTKRKQQTQKETGEKNFRDDEISEEIQEEDSTHDEYDQDSSISFEDDEGRTASQEDNVQDWNEHGKRSTEEAGEQMLTYNITIWVETQKKLKWRQALRIATPNPDRKAAEWNPGLIISTKDSMESRKTSQEMGRRIE